MKNILLLLSLLLITSVSKAGPCTGPFDGDIPEECLSPTYDEGDAVDRNLKNPFGKGPKEKDAEGSTGDLCLDAVKSTQKQCKGAEYAQYAPTLLNLAGAMASAKSAGNTKKACEVAKQIKGISGVTNAGVAAMCQRAISSCKSKCTKADDAVSIERCEEYETYAKLSTSQAIADASAMVGSQSCADAASGDCIGENAYTNSMCQEFCFKAANANHTKCLSASASCKNPSFAAQNVQYCTCLANPLSPSCRSGAGTPVPGTNASGLPDLGEDGIGAGDYDFNGSNAEAQAAKANSPQGGGGGFGGGGGGSSPFGEGGGGGNGDEPLNKEILTGTGGAAGGAGILGGTGGYGEGGGRSGRSGGGSEEKGFDLSQFLPGGKKDPTRNPASAGYDDPTITKANGLTNWQKVTRKINEKRPELMP
jgi:hypothetical protein